MRQTLSTMLLCGSMLCAVSQAWAQEAVSVAEDATNREVVFYPSGRALVTETRKLGLDREDTRLVLDGVAEKIAPGSILVEGIKTESLRFQASNLSLKAVIERHLGEEVFITDNDGVKRQEGTLLTSRAPLLVETDDGVKVVDPSRLIYPAPIRDMKVQPTISLTLPTGQQEAKTLSLSYLSGGFTWSARHTAKYDSKQGYLTWHTAAELGNDSGLSLEGAAVRLIAGQVTRSVRPMLKTMRAMPMGAMAESAPVADQITRQAVEGLHQYGPFEGVSLRNGESMQLSLVPTSLVSVKREITLSLNGQGYYSPRKGQLEALRPEASLTFINNNEPLPAGPVLVYGKDSSGAPLLLAEADMGDTAVGQSVELSIGKTFDITAQHSQTDFKLVQNDRNGRITESAYKLEIKNAAPQKEVVTVVEAIPGDWTLLESSAKPAPDDRNRLKWQVTVPAEGKLTLTWRLSTKL